MPEQVIYIILIYLAVINIISFILPPVDKAKAKKGKWRIRERTLFIFSAIGGSAAMYLSMQIFRHKTQHRSFMIGIPVIFVVQLATAIAVWFMFFR